MRPLNEIQADLDATKQKIRDLDREWSDTELALRRAKPLIAEERAVLEKLSRQEKTDYEELNDQESLRAHLLSNRGFTKVSYGIDNDGVWSITNLGRKKLEEKP